MTVNYVPQFIAPVVDGSPPATQGIANLDGFVDRSFDVRAYGARCDGTTDDTSALNAAILAASNAGGGVVQLPAGSVYITGNVDARNRVTLAGSGMERTTVTLANGARLYRTGVQSRGTYAYLGVRDLTVVGPWLAQQNDSGNTPIFLYGADEVRIERVKTQYTNSFAMGARSCRKVTIRDCIVQYSARDGMNLYQCEDVLVENNRFKDVDDDAIALGTSELDGSDVSVIPSRAVIRGNIIVDSQGIRLHSYKSAVVADNVLVRCIAPINVFYETGTSGALVDEAIGVNSGISITNNVILDPLNRTSIDNLNQYAFAIMLGGRPKQAGALTQPPGDNNTGTGAVTSPYDYYYQNVSTAALPVSFAISVIGNHIIRTLPDTVANYEAWGFGQRFTRSGYINPSTAAAAINTTRAIELFGNVHEFLVANNVVSGIRRMLYCVPLGHDVFRGVFRGNTIRDFSAAAFEVAAGSAYAQRLIFDGNTIDGDPFHASTNRDTVNADGTWQDVSTPAAFTFTNTTGVVTSNNHIRNVSRVNQSAIGTGNFVYCNPVAAGYDGGNAGVGNVPDPGPDIIHVIEDGNPKSATFRQFLNFCRTQSTAQPTTGTYVRGHFVRNTTPALAAGKVTIGWTRLTTGSGHVTNTDWAAAVVPNT